jgi:hypothetical protein
MASIDFVGYAAQPGDKYSKETHSSCDVYEIAPLRPENRYRRQKASPAIYYEEVDAKDRQRPRKNNSHQDGELHERCGLLRCAADPFVGMAVLLSANLGRI